MALGSLVRNDQSYWQHSVNLEPTEPLITVAAGDLGEMEVSFNVTSGDLIYHLWRGNTDATADLKLNTASVNDGTFTDTFQITPGDVYCYKGAVEKNGVISDKSTTEVIYRNSCEKT